MVIVVRLVSATRRPTEHHAHHDRDGRPASTRQPVTILDPTAAPAEDLSTLYAQRWEVETIFDELKTHQRGPKVVLRSKTPDGVRQEAYGYLCLHYAVRALDAHRRGRRRAGPRPGLLHPLPCAPLSAAPAPRAGSRRGSWPWP